MWTEQPGHILSAQNKGVFLLTCRGHFWKRGAQWVIFSNKPEARLWFLQADWVSHPLYKNALSYRESSHFLYLGAPGTAGSSDLLWLWALYFSPALIRDGVSFPFLDRLCHLCLLKNIQCEGLSSSCSLACFDTPLTSSVWAGGPCQLPSSV